jgi:hypothetical protein
MTTTHRNVLVLLALIAAGCGDGSSGGAARVAPALSPAIAGRVPGAPEGTVVHLLAPGEVAADAGLLAHAEAIVDTLDVGADGGFALEPGAAAPASLEVLVSAPGRALLRVPFAALAGGEVALEPEAVISLRLARADGAPEVDAVAVVLGRDGAPLPLPPETLASGIDGELRATRLPGGDYTLVVGSADGRRHAMIDVSVPGGARAFQAVTLTEDPEAERRFLDVVIGVDSADAAAGIVASQESAE